MHCWTSQQRHPALDDLANLMVLRTADEGDRPTVDLAFAGIDEAGDDTEFDETLLDELVAPFVSIGDLTS